MPQRFSYPGEQGFLRRSLSPTFNIDQPDERVLGGMVEPTPLPGNRGLGPGPNNNVGNNWMERSVPFGGPQVDVPRATPPVPPNQANNNLTYPLIVPRGDNNIPIYQTPAPQAGLGGVDLPPISDGNFGGNYDWNNPAPEGFVYDHNSGRLVPAPRSTGSNPPRTPPAQTVGGYDLLPFENPLPGAGGMTYGIDPNTGQLRLVRQPLGYGALGSNGEMGPSGSIEGSSTPSYMEDAAPFAFLGFGGPPAENWRDNAFGYPAPGPMPGDQPDRPNIFSRIFNTLFSGGDREEGATDDENVLMDSGSPTFASPTYGGGGGMSNFNRIMNAFPGSILHQVMSTSPTANTARGYTPTSGRGVTAGMGVDSSAGTGGSILAALKKKHHI